MSLGRAWTRQLLTASAGALLAPGAVIAALLLLSVSGGLGSLSALGQVLGGPAMPSVPGARTVLARHARSARLLSARASSSGHQGGGGATAGGTSNFSSRASARGGSALTRHGAGGPAGPGPSGGHGPSSGAGPAPSPGSGPTPKPGHRSTVVDRVVAAGAGVTSHIPGPAGQAATGALHSAGSALDGVLPPAP